MERNRTHVYVSGRIFPANSIHYYSQAITNKTDVKNDITNPIFRHDFFDETVSGQRKITLSMSTHEQLNDLRKVLKTLPETLTYSL